MPYFYVCACKSIPISTDLADFLESTDGTVQCLIAAARISCRDSDEVQRIVTKAHGLPLPAVPKALKGGLPEVADEWKWAEMPVPEAEPDRDEMYGKSMRNAIEQAAPRFGKDIKEKLQKFKQHSAEQSVDFKYLKERIKQHNSPAYDYPVFSEQEAFEKWDAIDLAAAQHSFEQWRQSKDDRENVDQKAFAFLYECDGIARILADRNRCTEPAPSTAKADGNDFQTILHKYPFPRTPEERALWIRAGEVAEIEKTVDTATLRKYRSGPATEKTADGLAGRDKDGRIWRKPGPNGQVLYLISSLRNKPK